ncbi:glutamine synthetase beta-grasp domain-containing protein [Cystobacter fuscus]
MRKVMAEYIWIDGQKPTAKLRSKMKVVEVPEIKSLSDLPDWGFDGSSTYQAEGKKSDLLLKPVRYIPNPLRPGTADVLVMCEVMNQDGSPHPSNTRAPARGGREVRLVRDVVRAGAGVHALRGQPSAGLAGEGLPGAAGRLLLWRGQ